MKNKEPSKEPSAVGVYDDLHKAEKSLVELERAGFRPEEIGIVGHVPGDQKTIPGPLPVKEPEEYATGGVIRGGIFGAVIGMLVLVVVPGLGWLSGAGFWFEVLFAGALGAAAGGALFAFANLVAPRPQARFYQRELEHGRFLVTVNNPERKDEAVSVLGRQSVHAEKTGGP